MHWPRAEVGAQRQARDPAGSELDAKGLVQLDHVDVEAESGRGHVEPPDVRFLLAEGAAVLNAAGWTYVAAAIAAIGQLLYYVLLLTGGSRRD